jgi:protocatechuate 3,4-dioxygenase beta subunit
MLLRLLANLAPAAVAMVVMIGGGPMVFPAPARASGTACRPTAPDMLGPFYVAGAPERSKTGEGLTVQGAVRSTRECKALPGARIEWWSADRTGAYDDDHRATQVSDAEGRFRYVTDPPGKYPGRPEHLHVKVTASGHKTLVTQIYPKRSQNSIAFDFVLQVD